MSDIILHHYPPSPVSEKVRIGLGMKKLAWQSVEIPRIPPKPDLMPLTGGYRRTPVMQVGADIYCDSQCILREIDRRHPEPSFYPGGGYGMPWALGRWTDGELFALIVSLVIATTAEQMPEDWVADRGRLYFGTDFDLAQLRADIDHNAAQLRAEFGWIDQRLSGGRDFMLGDSSGLPDIFCYYLVWFARERWAGASDLFAEFPYLEAWEKRVAAIGHGSYSNMDSGEALAIAQKATPATALHADPKDPQGLEPGMAVTVYPLGDSGDPKVAGVVRAVDRETIAILREDSTAGEICVHFPRAGYRVTKA